MGKMRKTTKKTNKNMGVDSNMNSHAPKSCNDCLTKKNCDFYGWKGICPWIKDIEKRELDEEIMNYAN